MDHTTTSPAFSSATTPERLNLNGVWRFIPDPRGYGETLGYHKPKHNVQFWLEADVPGIVDNYFPGIESYEGPMWFVREFKLPPATAARHWVLRFEAVNYRATVWINGRFLGTFVGGFLPFEWPLDPTLVVGENHRLTVCVDNRRCSGEVPGKLRGWRTQGGILREVYLESRPNISSELISLDAGADGSLALKFRLKGMVSELLQAEALEQEYAGIMHEPAICGITIWCYADHPWPEESFFNYIVRSPYGVVTRDRREKPACQVVRKLFQAPLPPAPSPQPADNYRIIMERPHLNDIPDIPFPEGFTIRPMKITDAGLWEDIWRDAEPFTTISDGLFMREFGTDPAAITRRCFLIFAPNGCAVGTISSWYNRNYKGHDYGRIHWVAIRPVWQGKGLAKAALSFALKIMAQWHDRAYLITSSGRTAAIKLYEKFGFVSL
jgi:ribosomal protein S18 acetylase RimI-like enzyme